MVSRSDNADRRRQGGMFPFTEGQCKPSVMLELSGLSAAKVAA